MIKYKEITIDSNTNFLFTNGLSSYIEKDIRLKIRNQKDCDYIEIIKYIINYIINEKPTILNNQTIGYYSWALQFKVQDSKFFDLFEVNETGEGTNEGCELSISIIRSQSEICSQMEVIPLFPSFNQNVVISKGVYEGKEIEGIRYDSPKHMSGWWLITDDYDDNIESLMTVPYHQVAFNRPDILKYLALPFGYRFSIEEGNVRIEKDEDE